MKYGRHYLISTDIASLRDTHPLVDHLYKMIVTYPKSHAFRNMQNPREHDTDYRDRRDIPKERVNWFMSCLMPYDLDVANVMRFAGKNYTGGFRNVKSVMEKMKGKVHDDLLTQYARIMLMGDPAHFVAESSRENAMLHWREGNHESVNQNPRKVLLAMTILVTYQFAIPLRSWIARFVPHLFFAPHHILKKPGKSDRIIFDAARRCTPLSTPVNRMTSTPRGVELRCE